MDRAAVLGNEPVGRLLLKFSVPAIVGMMVQSLYNVVDRIFIGQGVGALGLAGATIAFPFMLIFMAFAMLAGIGGNSVVSISLGEKKHAYAELVLANSFVLLILFSLGLTAAGYAFLDPLLRLAGASETVMPYAREYIAIILAGTVVNGIGFGMNNFIRGEGNPRIAMATMLIGAVLNIALDPLFIFGFKMGIAGAALATVLSQTVSAAWVMRYFLSGKSLLRIRRENLRLDSAVVRRILAVGSSVFAMQLAASVLNTILNNQLSNYGGDLAISVMGVVHSVITLIVMPIFGVNQGSQPIIGYNYGARRWDRVIRASFLAILFGTFFSTAGWAAARLFPGAIIGMFGAEGEFLALAHTGLRTVLFVFPVIGFQIVSSSYFQATGKPKHAMVLSLSRQVLFLIPLLFILPRFFGLDGVYGAMPVADALATVTTAIVFFREIRSLKRKPALNETVSETAPTPAPPG